MQAQEEERARLARELHDEIGQCVTAIHADAVAIRNRGGAPVRESADAIVEATGRIKDMVRSILRRLRPGALEGLGLGAALRELVGGFRQRNPQLSCALRLAEAAAEVQGETGIALYRTVQECLTNVSRHADARAVEVELGLSTGADGQELLECSVRDDGRGFDERAGAGFGLLGIRERVKALGGSCLIEGRPGRGSCVTVRLPLPEAEGA
jgi:two-component system sensor histidine kinase UhpB